MKVKVGDEVYSDEDHPIMIILTDKDKENINNMAQGCNRYASAPDGSMGDADEFVEWMNDYEK